MTFLRLREDRPATIQEHRELREKIEWLRIALEEIRALPEVRLDEAPIIAARALEAANV